MERSFGAERRDLLASLASSSALLAGCTELLDDGRETPGEEATTVDDPAKDTGEAGTDGGGDRGSDDGADGVGWLMDGVAIPETGADVQTAIDAVEARGYVALRPSVTYEIDEPLTWPNTRDLQGLYMGTAVPDGRSTAAIAPSDDFTGDALIEWHGVATDDEWNFLRDVGLFGLDLRAWGDVTLVDARNVARIRYEDVSFENTAGHAVYNRDTWDARYHDCVWSWVGDDAADTWAVYAVDGCNTHFFEGCRWEGTRGGFFKTTSRAASPSWKKHSSYFFDRCKFHGHKEPAERVSVPHFDLGGRWGDGVGFHQCVHVWPPSTGIRVGSDVPNAYFANVRWLDAEFDVAPVDHTERAVAVHGTATFQGCTAQGIGQAVVDATEAERVVDAGTNDFDGTFNDGAVAFEDPNDRIVYCTARGTGSGPIVRDERSGRAASLARLGGEGDTTLDVGRGDDGQFRIDDGTQATSLLALTTDGDLSVGGDVHLGRRERDPGAEDLPAGACTLYVADGSGGVTGDEGDVVAAVNVDGEVRTTTILDFGEA